MKRFFAVLISFQFYCLASEAQSGRPLYVDTSGNVGIGTNSPLSPLEINLSNTRYTPALNIKQAGNNWGTPAIFNQYRFLQTNSAIKDGFRQFNVGAGGVSIGYADVPAYNSPHALFVNGRVGIGTNAPETMLHVNGDVKTGNLSTNGSIDINGLFHSFINMDPRGGTYAMSAPGLYIGANRTAGEGETDFFNSKGAGSNGGFNFYSSASGNTNGAPGVPLLSMKESGKIGVNTNSPSVALEVNGDIKATTLNGEKPPYVFEINPEENATEWHSKIIPSSVIKSYLGDADGGTIKIMLRTVQGDDVRIITETIYYRQAVDKADNGHYGYTRQLQAGESFFRVGTTAKFDLIPAPWAWIWMRNYHSSLTAPKTEGPAWTGTDAYQVEFLTNINIAATVIIYDR